MDKNKKEENILYVFVAFVALMFGLAVRDNVLSNDADDFTATIVFVSVTTVIMAIYMLFKMVIGDSYNYFMKRQITNKIKNSVEAPTKEVESEVLSQVVTSQVNEIEEPVINSEIKTKQIYIEIDPDEIFMSRMLGKFDIIEKRLIADKYLSVDLYWIAKHKNGKIDKQRLICFITGLIDSSYFMSNRDSMIRSYFEARYKMSLGQNFEPARREQYITEYKIKFFNYPF